MCQVFAFPPKMPKELALSILTNSVGGNDDGVGYVFVRDAKFVLKKYPESVTEVLKKQPDFFQHMPHDGWTIAHLRAKTHGDVAHRNTHPFIKGSYAVVHNGIFSAHEEVRPIAAKHGLEGETDSEVAAWILSELTPKGFVEGYKSGGVFLALGLDGTLHVSKLSGYVQGSTKDGVTILGTSLPAQMEPNSLMDGYAKLLPDGTQEVPLSYFSWPSLPDTQKSAPCQTHCPSVHSTRHYPKSRRRIVEIEYDHHGLLLHDPSMSNKPDEDYEPTDEELALIERETLRDLGYDPDLWKEEDYRD